VGGSDPDKRFAVISTVSAFVHAEYDEGSEPVMELFRTTNDEMRSQLENASGNVPVSEQSEARKVSMRVHALYSCGIGPVSNGFWLT
jgi:hypothetical protein